jgi:hypothetical protein
MISTSCKFYPVPSAKGKPELLGIISMYFDVAYQLLIIFFAFIKYLGVGVEAGLQWDSASTVQRFQEDLLFS